MSNTSENNLDYDIQVHHSTSQIDAFEWNELLGIQAQPTPFMKMEYLRAMELSKSATTKTGWTPRFITIKNEGKLIAACPLYLKAHSYGEFVFDWAWASAYEQHGLAYYPKALIAVPFTPVPGTRLMAIDEPTRDLLVTVIKDWVKEQELSSLHLLFGAQPDLKSCTNSGLLLRHTVQFHWQNSDYIDFNDFLSSLNQEKRKKIRQERSKVTKAGVHFIAKHGAQINAEDWSFFYTCYEQTYYEHGNSPYLTPAFFESMKETMPENWVLFIAIKEDGTKIASSLVALSNANANAQDSENPTEGRVAYGRYWGALQRVDCLHFEACYYAPIEWCIQNKIARFEGGAQGEHKMARALMPTRTSSAHYLVHPSFADAVKNFLQREEQGIENYMEDLERRSPLKGGNGNGHSQS